MSSQELEDYAKETLNLNVEMTESLYSLYRETWPLAVYQILLEECQKALKADSSFEEIEEVLSADVFLPIKAKIICALKNTN